MIATSLDAVAARQLRDALASLLHREQAAMADFLVALADFDRRRGWGLLGHASLFAFLHVELRLSRSASFWRLSAARLLQRFPDVIEPLRDGRLCLSSTAELAKVLTPENLAEVLPRYFGLSAREACEITAELAPREQPPARTVVTSPGRERNSSALAQLPPAQQALAGATRTPDAVLTSEPAPSHPARDTARRDDVEPLTADLRRLHLTVDRQFLRMVESARDGLSHSIPGASIEQVLKAALELLLEKQARARGQVKRPRKAMAPLATHAPAPTPSPAPTAPPNATDSAIANPSAAAVAAPGPSFTEPLHRRTGPRETIPAVVRRAVWERDGGRCAWPQDGGGRCGSTHQLEVDHVMAWALGGQPTVEDLRLLCRPHNLLAARQAFGTRRMERYAGATPSHDG